MDYCMDLGITTLLAFNQKLDLNQAHFNNLFACFNPIWKFHIILDHEKKNKKRKTCEKFTNFVGLCMAKTSESLTIAVILK